MARLFICFCFESFLFGCCLFANEIDFSAYIFKELSPTKWKGCGNPCSLELSPYIGSSFDIEYTFYECGKRTICVNLKLNGKSFSIKEIAMSSVTRPLPFVQKYFFSDHRFQIYTIPSSMHIHTGYNHYFRRDGDIFHYLGRFVAISYDYEEKKKKDNERFFADQGGGGGNYRRTYYKLENNAFIEIGSKLFLNNESNINSTHSTR